MVVFRLGGCIGAKWLSSSKSCCNRASEWSIRKKPLYSGKNGFVRQSGYIWAKVVVLRAKVVVVGQRSLHSAQLIVFWQKWLCSGKVVVFGRKWLVSGKSGCIQAKVHVFGQGGSIWARWLY